MKITKIPKYRNVKSGGYHSKGEHNRAVELQLLQKAGDISNLTEQVRISLLEHFGKHYIADFVYFFHQNEALMIEDYKGFRTDLYSLKRDIILNRYDGFIFIETLKNNFKHYFPKGNESINIQLIGDEYKQVAL